MQSGKPIILTLVRYYLPGYKHGGPTRTIANMVERLGDEFDFRVVALDRDVGSTGPYRDITLDGWNRRGKAAVYYARPGPALPGRLEGLLSATPHHLLYLSSAMDPVFTLWPLLNRKLRRLPRSPVVLAPRGEFAASALALKRWKKGPFLTAARFFDFYRDITWQASSAYEARDIERVLDGVSAESGAREGSARRVIVAPDLPAAFEANSAEPEGGRGDGPLRVLFLSRITPIKNLDFALRVLGKVTATVDLSIYGPTSSGDYWRECEALIASLPANVRATYLGEVDHARVGGIMAAHDLFFLPTRGENYGHVIAEALSAGTPVLIADTTPWRNLAQARAGWDLPLTDESSYVERIEYCARLQRSAYTDWRAEVRRFAAERLTAAPLVEANRRLFLTAMAMA